MELQELLEPKNETKKRRKLEERSNEDLLAEYKRTKDQEIKKELVMRYLYVVQGIAGQMRDVYAGFAQIDDIINEGVLAVMNGLDKFDMDKNVTFETYITKRIRGMVVDLARKQDWIPRSVRKYAKDIENTAQQLYNQLGRYPSDEEVAEELNLPVEKLRQVQGKTAMFNVLSLDMVLEQGTDSRMTVQIPSENRTEQPENRYLDEEFKAAMVQAINGLKEKEQQVISLYYLEELNMKDIAKVMSVSEPRISQIHANAILKLKLSMEKYINNKK